MKRIYIISSVRNANEELRKKLEEYAEIQIKNGNKVYLPHRDTKQNVSEYSICVQNKKAISDCEEVHIFYDKDSQGSHFDLGMAFMYEKPIKVIEATPTPEGKSFQNLLVEWEAMSNEPFPWEDD